jgi:hypothetical protein
MAYKLTRASWIAAALIGAVVVALAVWRVSNRVQAKPVGDSLFQKTKALVEKTPRLQPDWEAALADGVLTLGEVQSILEKAGEAILAEG